MDILNERTANLYETVKGMIEEGNLNSVDEVAEAIVKGADKRCVVFGSMRESAMFKMMGEIDSESLYQLVESR